MTVISKDVVAIMNLQSHNKALIAEINALEAKLETARADALREAAQMALGCGLIISPESVSQRVGAEMTQLQVSSNIRALIDKEPA